MAIDRAEAIKKAEKLLRQGKLDLAIAEYEQMVEEQPRDWNTRNALGDLYVRASQTDRAAEQYRQIADHLFNEGFYPKAGALYKKILKIKPDDESVHLHLGEISAKQGLLADAKAYFVGVAARRKQRGDQAGGDEIVIRLGSLDPADFDARALAARTLAENGDGLRAAGLYRSIHADLLEKGRADEALAALRESVRLNPDDVEGRASLARGAVASGDLETAKLYLDRAIAADDPNLLLPLLEIELRGGNIDGAREILSKLHADAGLRSRVVELAWTLASTSPEAAYACVDGLVDVELAARRYMDAAAILQEFVTRVPGQVVALMKLVEICVDGGLEAIMYEAQAQLADAYLERGNGAEARVIAEDLVAREPWEHTHIGRFRRALEMLQVPDPDEVIANRLAGQGPFVATDPFMAPESFDMEEPRTDLPADAPVENPPQPAPPSTTAVPTAVEPRVAETQAQTEPAPPPPAAEAAAGPDIPLRARTGEPDIPLRPRAAEPDIPLRPRAVEPDIPLRPRQPAAPGAAPPEGLDIDLTSALSEIEGVTTPPAPATTEPAQDLEAVFGEFRSQLSKQSDASEAAEYLGLAKTYLEMEMHDEAIEALKTAAKAPSQRFEAASILGRQYLQQNDLVHAIEWLERAAEAPAPGVTEARQLLYDLGSILESSGETARALAVFLELQADAGEYRDVAARVERLARVQAGG